VTIIVDAHQDLAWNMLTFDRQYTRSAAETRTLEAGTIAPLKNGDTMLGWQEYQQARVAVIFATLFAAPIRRQLGSWDRLCYSDQATAYRLYREQLDLYHRLVDEHPTKFRIINGKADLDRVLRDWEDSRITEPGIGLVLSMEGAEGLRSPSDLDEWWDGGVRLIGPAWTGTRFCGGTREPGGFTQEGYALLETMNSFGFGLDISHMDITAALQALDTYPGTIIASHSNALSLLHGSKSNRHLTDDVIHGLCERDGVMGIVLTNSFLRAGWERGDDRELVPLTVVVDQIDYACQVAGNANHVGLGTDLDGGFGLQSVPAGLESIADLPRLEPLLSNRGFSQSDIEKIMGGNWLRILSQIL